MFLRPDIILPLTYIVAAIPYAGLGLYAWRRRPAVAVTPFAWAMLGMSIWTFTYGLEIFFSQLPIKLFFIQIEYIGLVISPAFMLFFAFDYSGNRHLLTNRTRLLIWVIPVITLAGVWTNSYHHLMWDMETLILTRGLVLLSLHYGPLFWIHALASYGMLAVACIILTIELIERPGIYRAQISIVILSIAAPLVGSIIYVTGMGPVQNLDLAPLFFLPTAFGLFWAIIRYRLLEVLPTEHFTVIKNIRDGVVVLNSQYRILYLNPTAEKLLESNEENATGQPLAKVSESLYQNLLPFFDGGENTTEIAIGNAVYEAHIAPVSSLKPRKNPDAFDWMINLHDVTERKEAEGEMNRRETIISSISYAAEQFLKDPTWERKVPDVLAKLGRAVDVSRVLVAVNYKNPDDSINSSLCYEWAAPGIPPQIDNPALQHVPLTESGFNRWKDNLSNGIPIQGMVKDFPEQEREFLSQMQSLSMAVIPIHVGSHWWGFIMFDECRVERHWTDTELSAFHTAANLFGAAESRARTEQQVLRRQRALSLLNEIVGVSLQAEDVEKMARVVVNRLGELISADGCFLTLWDEATNQPIPVAAYGPTSRTYKQIKPVPGGRTFTESALKAGHTLVVEDVEKTRYADPEVTHNFPSKSALVLPLIANKKKLGAVILAYNKTHRFQKEEIAISEQAAALIALALEKFQAVESAKRRADTSELLRKAIVSVAEKLEMDQTVLHIFEQLNQVVPYDSASIQLLEGDELHIVGGHGWDNLEEIRGLRFPVAGENPNRVVMKTGKPYYLPEARDSYKKFSEPPHDHIRSWLGVPLIAQDKLIGLLAIDSKTPGHFKSDDINIAMMFADQVAVVLENARIFQETQQQAVIDSLTKIYNRRGLLQFGSGEFEKSKDLNGKRLTAIMADIDWFKKVNDTYGHDAGDKVLQAVALQCKKGIREIDLIGRYGGEEIVILLLETDLEAGYTVAERLRKAIEAMSIQISNALQINVTASLGVACLDENTTDLTTLINRADQAMYVAKHNGRNQVARSI